MGVAVQFRVGGIRKLGDHALKFATDLGNLSDPFHLAGIRLQGTREEIFERQGDPVPWKQSQRAIDDEGETLVDTRALLNSMTSNTAPGSFLNTSPKRLEVGTTLNYAKKHDDGYSFTAVRGGRSFTVTIPQRKFTNLRPSDMAAVVEVFETWMLGKFDNEVFVP